MSHHKAAREIHGEHTDARNEFARVAKVKAHEDEIRRLLNERHARRFQALMPTGDLAPVRDFGTWVTL